MQAIGVGTSWQPRAHTGRFASRLEGHGQTLAICDRAIDRGTIG